MPISERTLSQWSHHGSGTAFKQAHVPIRDALAAYGWPSEVDYRVFLQGSYRNDTNLGGESDVDVVVRLASRLRPRVADLSGKALQNDGSHKVCPATLGVVPEPCPEGDEGPLRRCYQERSQDLKLPKGELPADADLVVTMSYRDGIAFYLPGQKRWVVSFPEQHHARGAKKEKATGNRFKRTVRMFKAARNRLVEKEVLTKDDAPSYFIECLLYNVPNGLFAEKLAPTYTGILGWLGSTELKDFQCQSERAELFGPGREQWSQKKARAFKRALGEMWDMWGK